jgi:hypothetical protein
MLAAYLTNISQEILTSRDPTNRFVGNLKSPLDDHIERSSAGAVLEFVLAVRETEGRLPRRSR